MYRETLHQQGKLTDNHPANLEIPVHADSPFECGSHRDVPDIHEKTQMASRKPLSTPVRVIPFGLRS
jgi:hypothetical protein